LIGKIRSSREEDEEEEDDDDDDDEEEDEDDDPFVVASSLGIGLTRYLNLSSPTEGGISLITVA